MKPHNLIFETISEFTSQEYHLHSTDNNDERGKRDPPSLTSNQALISLGIFFDDNQRIHGTPDLQCPMRGIFNRVNLFHKYWV